MHMRVIEITSAVPNCVPFSRGVGTFLNLYGVKSTVTSSDFMVSKSPEVETLMAMGINLLFISPNHITKICILFSHLSYSVMKIKVFYKAFVMRGESQESGYYKEGLPDIQVVTSCICLSKHKQKTDFL